MFFGGGGFGCKCWWVLGWVCIVVSVVWGGWFCAWVLVVLLIGCIDFTDMLVVVYVLLVGGSGMLCLLLLIVGLASVVWGG